MKIKRLIFLCVLSFLLAKSNHATTWQTVSPGYWNQGGMWLGGIVPPLSSSDTFLIKHPIALTGTLTLNSSAYLRIDSVGGICGHQKIIVRSSAKILKYGILELDTLDIPGGIVNCVAPGSVVLTQNAILSLTGASFNVTGCSLSVGPWFDCIMPEYNFALGITGDDVLGDFVSVFPNPNHGECTLYFSENLVGATFELVSTFGQTVFTTKIDDSQFTINLSELRSGMYFFIAYYDDFRKNPLLKRQKLVILN